MARRRQTTVSEPIISSDDEMRESESFKDSSLLELVSILPCRLQLAIMTKKPKFEENENFYLFSTDEKLLYANFYEDFGPLNLAKLYRYCNFLNNALQQETRETKTIIHYTRKDPRKILNAAFLIGCYCLIYLRFSVQTVMKALGPILKHANCAKFCDASINDLAYLSLRDVLSGVFKAIHRNFFNFEDFNVNDYEYYECVENGDLNWIVPGKLLAFCGPNSRTERTSDSVLLGPEFYIEYFQAHNVNVVVRLNSPKYNAQGFTKAGIQHFDLYFSDGSTPSEKITKQFLKICENARGAVAVHCKAGLGRTGTLIGAYLIKHYRFSAMESIGWLRICRPGSVIGQQQAWLNNKQNQLLQEGELFRQQSQHITYPPEKHTRGVYSMQVGMETEDTPNTKTATFKPTTGHKIETENVQGIAQRVDTMCLNDEDEQDSERLDDASQVNNNVVHCKPNRIKKVSKLTSRYIRGNRLNGGRTIVTTTTTTTTTIRRGRANANVPPLGGAQQRASQQETHVSRKKTTVTSRQTVPSRTETLAAPSIRNQRNASVQTASQGDQLNSIKAARRHHVPTDSIQQNTGSSKIIQPPTSTNTNPSEHNIKPSANAADKDKAVSTLQTRSETAKITNPAERKSIKRLTIFLAPPAKNCPQAEQPIRPVAPTSTETRYDFSATVITNVTQGKKVTFEIPLNFRRLLGTVLSGNAYKFNPATMKKSKTYQTWIQIVPETPNHLTDVFTFIVRINMDELISGDTADSQLNTNGNTSKQIKCTSIASSKDVNAPRKGMVLHYYKRPKAPTEEERLTVKPIENKLPAKLTWLKGDRNLFIIRVTFDLVEMNNLIPVPAYIYDQNRSAKSEVNRQFETNVSGLRESYSDLWVNYCVKLDLQQVLNKPKLRDTLPPKAAAQPCSSPSNDSLSCPGVLDLREDVNRALLMLDHNGNDRCATAQHEQQMLDKPKVQDTLPPKADSNPCWSPSIESMSCPGVLDLFADQEMYHYRKDDAFAPTQHGKEQTLTPHTTNTNAETDARPYKRLRVDSSRP